MAQTVSFPTGEKWKIWNLVGIQDFFGQKEVSTWNEAHKKTPTRLAPGRGYILANCVLRVFENESHVGHWSLGRLVRIALTNALDTNP